MKIKLIIFCIIFCVAIAGLIVYKKISPETFRTYLLWILFIILIALILYKPWMIFV